MKFSQPEPKREEKEKLIVADDPLAPSEHRVKTEVSPILKGQVGKSINKFWWILIQVKAGIVL